MKPSLARHSCRIMPALIAMATLLSCARGGAPGGPEPGGAGRPAGDTATPQGTLAIPPLPLPRVTGPGQEDPGEPGLEIRLREADGGPAPAGTPDTLAVPAPRTEPLSEARTAALLGRLPALPGPVAEGFRFPPASPPPPRTGRTLLSTFPPPDSVAEPARPTQPMEPAPLDVVRIVPSGEADLAPHLTITFSEAMVPLTTVAGTGTATPPVRLTPQPPGRWQWIDTRTLRFQPDGRFPMATEYVVEVPAGTRSAAGVALTAAVRADFATPAPRAIGAYPALHPESGPERDPQGPPRPWASDEHARAVSLQPVIVIAFDQQIDPAAVLRQARLRAGGRARSLRLATADEVAADSVARALVARLPEGRWVALRPLQPLPAATDVRITLERGTPSAEGPRTTRQPQELRFRTYGPFRVTWHGCWDDSCRPGQPFRIQLSNLVDEASWSPELVQVEPALPDMVVQLLGSEISITGESRANTQYRVTLSAGLRDRFGQSLQEPRTVTVRVGAPQPSIMLQGAPFMVLDPDGPPRIMVHTQGHRALRVRIHRVTPEQWADFGAALERWERSSAGTLNPPGTQVSSTVVEPAGGAAGFAETAIDMSPALTAGLGHAIVVVQPEGSLPFGADRVFQRNAAVAWVQSTRIGVTAAVDARDMFVWTTSLRTGRPLAGVELTAVPTGRRTTTSTDGIGSLPLTAPGDAAVVARAGADAALLPAHEYAMGRATPWERRPATNELRWFTFTDRGLYRPGETVHVKGWLRRMPADRNAGLSLAPDVTGVALRMRGPRQEELADITLRPGTLGGFDTTVELPKALNLGHAGIRLEAMGSPDAGTEAWLGVQVQEFRRPEYEVTVQADPGPYVVGDVVSATLDAGYYGGGGLAGAPLDWRVSTQPARYVPPGWQHWRFGRADWWGARGGGPRPTHELSSATDASGTHRLLIDLLAVEPPFVTSVRAEAQVHDLTRQVGSGSVDVLVHPAAVNVGLRTSRSWVSRGQPTDIEFVVVDHAGRTVAGRAVEISAERMPQGWWPRGGTPEPGPARVLCAATSAAEPSVCTFAADSSGSHRIRADVTDDAGRVSRTEIMVWVAGAPGAPDPTGQPGRFEVVSDRDEYQPGDTARILVQPPFHPAEALLTLRGSGVLETRRFSIETPSHELLVPITESHIPGVTVRVDVVDAERGVNFGFGEAQLTVPPHQRALDVRITPRDTLAVPGTETVIDVEVRDTDGRIAADAEVALWMVDESVLALGGYAMNDPLQLFYAPRHGYIQDQHTRQWVVHWPRSAGPGTLSGVVLAGAGGRGMAGATVRIAETAIETRTGFDGSFTLRGVTAGEHVLEVIGPDGSVGRRTVSVPAAGTHIGNVVLGAAGLVTARLEAQQMDARTAVAAVTAAPPPAPPPPPGMALESLVVTGKAGTEPDVDVRTDFSPLAVFEPALRTDAGGRVQVRVRLPESLTRYRVMAVAVAGAQRFGTGEAAVTARKDLMVRVTAPRFLNHGDVFELPVLVQNSTARPMSVELAVRASGLAMTAPAGQRFTLAPGARAEARFAAEALHAGTASIQVVAVTADGLSDAAAAAVPVLTPATVEAFATYGSIDTAAPVVLPLARPAGVIEAFGGLEVTITSTALHSLTDAVLYLHRYPFEGSEHIASRILAVAALRDVLSAFGADGLPPPDELVASTQRDISDLVARQQGDGGWPFWRVAGPTNPFVTMHAAHALERARENGFDVPAASLERAVRFLADIDRHVARWPLPARQSASAYAIYVRHRIGDPAAVRDARRLAASAPDRVGGELPIEAAGWLLYVIAQDPAARTEADELRRTLINRMVETAGSVTFAGRYEDGAHLLLHSSRRTDAVVLEALIAAGADADIITRLAQSLLAHRVSGRWGGTQENAWVLLALDRYFRTYEATTPSFRSGVWLDDRFAGSHTFEGRTTERQHVSVPMPEVLRSGPDELVISREGSGRMYYRAGLRYAPADPRVAAADRGFEVSRVYEAVDDPADVRRDSDGTWHVRAGARVRVRVSMIAPSVRYHAALVDPLPAGFEPLNPELQGTGFTDEPPPPPVGIRPDPRSTPAPPPPPGPWRPGWFEHQNLRDDRAEAFASLLPAGSYEYTYLVRATTPGTFVAAPPRAEMMYQPETFGRGVGGVVVVSGGGR